MLILFILIINVVLYVLFCRQEVYFREEEMIRNQLKELEYESAHYRELEQHQQEIRRIRHDIKMNCRAFMVILKMEKWEKEKGD